MPATSRPLGSPRGRFAPVLASLVAASFALAAAVFAASDPAPEPAVPVETLAREVGAVLDAFHVAASRADEAAYFDLLAPNGVFLGTDATERWDKESFRAFAHPYFAQGKGWTFKPRDRHLDFAAEKRVAYFDELLDSETYGECRGSGVLELRKEGWKILQYHLTIPLPNDLAKEFVARIRQATARPKDP